MIITVSRDQLLHDLALAAANAYLDAYVKTELDPSIGMHFGGSDLAREALIAYGQAIETLDFSIAEEED